MWGSGRAVALLARGWPAGAVVDMGAGRSGLLRGKIGCYVVEQVRVMPLWKSSEDLWAERREMGVFAVNVSALDTPRAIEKAAARGWSCCTRPRTPGP